MQAVICMMVGNDVTSDPRVTREANSLGPRYVVKVIGATSDKKATEQEQALNCNILRVKRGDSAGRSNLFLKVLERVITHCKIAYLAYQQRADVYHAHDLDMLPFAFLIARLRRAKVVYDSHELWVEQRADFPKWLKPPINWAEKYFIRRVDAVITVNHSIAHELMERYNIHQLPTVIHNFSSHYDQSKHVETVRNRPVVLYHGGYSRDRGLEEVVESVSRVSTDVIFTFRGKGSLESELRNRVKELHVTDKVQFFDPVSLGQLIEKASSADIGIIPYKPTCLNNYYSLPNKLSEYAMAGLAICASDLPEIRRLNEQYQFGELFDPYDPDSIAAAINKLASDSEYLARCKRNALTWAETIGNWEAEQPKLLQLYRELLGEQA